MNLMRWDPFGEVDTLFQNLMANRLAHWPLLGGAGSAEKSLRWSPSADISETDKEYLIRAQLPAVRKEDVEVILDRGVITIKGERKQQQEDKNERYHRVESFFGSFERSFSLPENVSAEAIRCESKDGILSVHIPKTETTKQSPKQIAVQ